MTIATASRRPVFRDLDFGRACIDRLCAARELASASIYAYCLMPDHVHLLLGIGSNSLSAFVQRWKSLCYRDWRERGHRKSFWQRGFYDRALRRGEDVRAVAFYILANPVRAGLVEDHRAYPLGGSLEWDEEAL